MPPLALMGSKPRWPAIRERVNASGTISFVVDGIIGGERLRSFHKTKGEAETKAAQMRAKRANEGATAFGLPAPDRVDAETALGLLKPHGVRLEQAAQFYLRHLEVIRQSKTAGEAVAELLVSKEQDRKSARYLGDMRNRLETFANDKTFAALPIHEITARQLEDWLRRLRVSPITRNNFRRLIGVLFGFALKRGYVLKNPVKNVEIANVESIKPAILSVEETQALLSCASVELLPSLVVAVFAGLRPQSEIFRLDWASIHLDEKEIDIAQSKNLASHRYVKISDNLAVWLRPHVKTKGRVGLRHEPYYRHLQAARAKAAESLESQGIDATTLRAWGSDICRHTYASFHYGMWKSAAATAEQLGHRGNLQMLHRFYRARVRESAARGFWALLPS